MGGALVLVVGPSGAGKDTLIGAARAALGGDARFVFPQRVVTREAVAALEDHASVSLAAFARLDHEGAFALSWQAHGLSYGIPTGIRGEIEAGRVVVVNGSRRIAAAAQAAIPATRIVLVEADAAVRAARLAGRGREGGADIARRLDREATDELAGAIRIDNSGPVEAGIATFIAALRAAADD